MHVHHSRPLAGWLARHTLLSANSPRETRHPAEPCREEFSELLSIVSNNKVGTAEIEAAFAGADVNADSRLSMAEMKALAPGTPA
jgi:hypothetical protein